jgi:hypothetical protein
MFGGIRAFAIAAILALGALETPSDSASAMPLPIRQTIAAAEFGAATGSLYQPIGYRGHKHHRHAHRHHKYHGYYNRRCHSPEWNHIYRHHGLAHRPRHHYTPEGIHFYYDPFWDFEPWWCDDPQVVGRRFQYKHHHRAAKYRPKAHVRWCAKRYVSYDPRFNTFVGNNGKLYQCDSPYDFR